MIFVIGQGSSVILPKCVIKYDYCNHYCNLLNDIWTRALSHYSDVSLAINILHELFRVELLTAH